MNDISFEKEYLMISNYEKQVDIGKAHFLKYDQKPSLPNSTWILIKIIFILLI